MSSSSKETGKKRAMTDAELEQVKESLRKVVRKNLGNPELSWTVVTPTKSGGEAERQLDVETLRALFGPEIFGAEIEPTRAQRDELLKVLDDEKKSAGDAESAPDKLLELEKQLNTLEAKINSEERLDEIFKRFKEIETEIATVFGNAEDSGGSDEKTKWEKRLAYFRDRIDVADKERAGLARLTNNMEGEIKSGVVSEDTAEVYGGAQFGGKKEKPPAEAKPVAGGEKEVKKEKEAKNEQEELKAFEQWGIEAENFRTSNIIKLFSDFSNLSYDDFKSKTKEWLAGAISEFTARPLPKASFESSAKKMKEATYIRNHIVKNMEDMYALHEKNLKHAEEADLKALREFHKKLDGFEANFRAEVADGLSKGDYDNFVKVVKPRLEKQKLEFNKAPLPDVNSTFGKERQKEEKRNREYVMILLSNLLRESEEKLKPEEQKKKEAEKKEEEDQKKKEEDQKKAEEESRAFEKWNQEADKFLSDWKTRLDDECRKGDHENFDTIVFQQFPKAFAELLAEFRKKGLSAAEHGPNRSKWKDALEKSNNIVRDFKTFASKMESDLKNSAIDKKAKPAAVPPAPIERSPLPSSLPPEVKTPAPAEVKPATPDAEQKKKEEESKKQEPKKVEEAEKKWKEKFSGYFGDFLTLKTTSRAALEKKPADLSELAKFETDFAELLTKIEDGFDKVKVEAVNQQNDWGDLVQETTKIYAEFIKAVDVKRKELEAKENSDASEINRIVDDESSKHVDAVIKNLQQKQGQAEEEPALPPLLEESPAAQGPEPTELPRDTAEQTDAGRVEYIERLRQDLVDLQKELADSFVEKEKKSGLWGKMTGGKKKSEAKYEHYLAMYKDTKEKLISAEEMQLADSVKFLQSKEKELRAEIKEKYGKEKENIVSKAWRKAGDCNIYNLFEKKAKENPDSWWGREFKKWGVAGKVGGKMLSLRFGISMTLAGLGIHGPGMATQSEAFIFARSNMVGLGSGFGSRDVIDRVGRWIGDKKLKKVKDADELGDTPEEQYGELSELIEEYEGYAMVNKVDLSKNDDYARLLLLRGQIEEKLIEQRQELIEDGNAEKILEFLNNQEADGLDKLSQKIGSAKTKRWIKRGVSIAFGATIGVFTQMCLTAKAAKEQASQAYFAWAEGKQKAIEAAQEAQTQAQPVVEQVGATPVTGAPPEVAPTFKVPEPSESSIKMPTAERPVSVKSSGLAAAAETPATPQTETLDLSKLVKNSDLGKFFTDSHLVKAEFNYLQKLTEQYPELKNEETIKEILKAAEFHDGKASALPEVYKGTINTPIEAAANSKMLILEKILNSQKPDSIDRALDFLQRQNFNAHSLENMGIKGSTGLVEKMRAVLADFQDGDNKAGKRIFDALRPDQNRAIAPFEDAKGIVRIRGVGGDPRVLGADEFDKDKLLVGQAKGYGAKWQPPEITTQDVEEHARNIAQGKPGKIDFGFEKSVIDNQPTVPVSEDTSQLLKTRAGNSAYYQEAIKQSNGRVIEYHVDGGEVTAYDITPDLASATSAGVDAQTGAGEVAVRAASVAHNAPRPVPISELWSPSGSSSAGASHGGGGGSGGSGSSGGGVGIKPGHAVSKGGEAAVKPTDNHKPDALFTEGKIEKGVIKYVGKDAVAKTESPATQDSAVPEASAEGFLPETASFDDMEKAIDGMDWSHADMKKAKIFVRFMEMQQKLLDDNSSGLRKMLTDIVGDNVDTEAGKGWITRKVLGLSSRQKNAFNMIVNGINKHRSIAEIQKLLAQEMFIYDQAAGAEALPDAHNPNNLADYNRYAHAVLARQFDDSNVEMEALLQQTQAMGKHGGAASK